MERGAAGPVADGLTVWNCPDQSVGKCRQKSRQGQHCGRVRGRANRTLRRVGLANLTVHVDRLQEGNADKQRHQEHCRADPPMALVELL